MKFANALALDEFVRVHRNSKNRLDAWKTTVRKAEWSNFAQLRETCGSADKVGPNIVFDVGSDRIVVVVNFAFGVVSIKRVMTHAEYEKVDVRRL